MELTSNSYGRFILKPIQSRPKKFFSIILMAIVWNGLTGLAIYAVATQWKGGAMYIVAVVLFVFALIGLLMIYSIGYQFILLFSPRATLTIGSNNLRFGGILDLNWSFTMPQLVQNLEFWLDVDDPESDAKSVCIYNVSESSMAGRGQASIKLPEKGSYKRNYILNLKAKIKYLPDIDQEYPLEVN
jgi:hypothetical protein